LGWANTGDANGTASVAASVTALMKRIMMYLPERRADSSSILSKLWRMLLCSFVNAKYESGLVNRGPMNVNKTLHCGFVIAAVSLARSPSLVPGMTA
jgi:hypothetical protein